MATMQRRKRRQDAASRAGSGSRPSSIFGFRNRASSGPVRGTARWGGLGTDDDQSPAFDRGRAARRRPAHGLRRRAPLRAEQPLDLGRRSQPQPDMAILPGSPRLAGPPVGRAVSRRNQRHDPAERPHPQVPRLRTGRPRRLLDRQPGRPPVGSPPQPRPGPRPPRPVRLRRNHHRPGRWAASRRWPRPRPSSPWRTCCRGWWGRSPKRGRRESSLGKPARTRDERHRPPTSA